MTAGLKADCWVVKMVGVMTGLMAATMADQKAGQTAVSTVGSMAGSTADWWDERMVAMKVGYSAD